MLNKIIKIVLNCFVWNSCILLFYCLFDLIFSYICLSLSVFISLSLSPESVRLVNGTSECSGRVEVKSNQSWVSVFEGDFDQQDTEVVCRELGCGAPSVLQGELYGEVNATMWTEEFQCEGNDSALLDCGTSNSTRNTSSPDATIRLTCSGKINYCVM